MYARVFFALLFFLAVTTPHYVRAAVDPIMWLKFDDGSGTTPQDSSSNNIDGSFSATQPTWSTVVPDVAFSNPYSLSFAGTNDKVSVSWPAGENFGATDPRTFSFWYKPTANGEGTYSRLISWTSDQLEIAGTEGGGSTHKITYYDGNWHATNITLSIGTWYHVTFTYDGTTAKFYIGNELQDEHSLAGRALSGTMMIGNRVQDGNEGINGNIDDVRVYDYALTSSQVANLAAGSSDPDSAPDETAPTISSESVSVTSSGATITWTTNEVASTKIVYSVDSNYASSTTEIDTSTRVTSHSQAISSLLACTTYNSKAVSRDAAGNTATSTGSTFTTSGCAGGVTPIGSNSTGITVSSAATTTMSVSSRLLEVVTPANFTATSSTITLQIKGLTASAVLASIGKPSSSLSSAAGVVFDVKALINNVTELDSFDTPVTITYTYTNSDASGLNESSLSMYHYANSTWSELDDCIVDTAANTITCEAPHFSIFAIFGTAPSSSSSSSNSSSGASALPWCSGPNAPGWNISLPDGGCSKKVISNSVCPVYTFTRQLSFGMKGEDVRALQKLMNCLGFKLASTGPGSPGNETNLFVGKTHVAVVKFQEMYSSDILTPVNATKGTGIFATYSQKKVQALSTQ